LQSKHKFLAGFLWIFVPKNITMYQNIKQESRDRNAWRIQIFQELPPSHAVLQSKGKDGTRENRIRRESAYKKRGRKEEGY